MHIVKSKSLLGSYEEPVYLSVIVPAFNENKRLPPTLALFEEIAGEIDMEIIIVCDGCTDDTASVLEDWVGRLPIKIISYTENRGKGYAVRKGILAATGNVISFIDADGSTPPKELLRLINILETRKVDIVIGSRRVIGAIVKRQPIKRQVLGGLFSFFTKAVLSLPCHDTQCGCKLFRRNAARLLFRITKYNGFEFDLDVLYLAHNRGLKIFEAGITWNDVAGSKVNVISDGLKMIQAVLAIKMAHIQFVRSLKKQYLSIISLL